MREEKGFCVVWYSLQPVSLGDPRAGQGWGSSFADGLACQHPVFVYGYQKKGVAGKGMRIVVKGKELPKRELAVATGLGEAVEGSFVGERMLSRWTCGTVACWILNVNSTE
jgi:hypothetical protein